MARTDPQVNIRMNIDLKNRLEEAAAQAGRSLNAEIVLRLDQSLNRSSFDIANFDEMLGRLDERGRQVMMAMYETMLTIQEHSDD